MHDTAKAEISCTDLKKRLDAGDRPVILDVREDHELAICKLDHTAHIPMGQLQARLAELEPHKDKEIVVYCRSGGRSGQCVKFMRAQGYNAVNLAGGTLAWSDQVDPSVAKY